MIACSFRLLLFLWLSVTLICGPAVVVCRAADGRMAIEIAHGECEEHSGEVLGGTSVADEAPSCDDSAVFDASMRVEERAGQVVLPPPVKLTLAITLAPLGPEAASLVSESIASRPPSHLTPLASTVLRI